MQYASVEEKNAFYSAEQKQLCLVFDDGTMIDNEDIAMESMNLEQTLCDTDELRFGKVASACFKTQIVAESIKRYRNLWFDVFLKAGEHEKQLGRFRVYSDELTTDRKYRDIVAYDAMYWVMNTDVTEWYNGLTFPVTQKAFRDSLFAYLGIEQEEVELPNDTIEIEKTVNAENFTGLTVLQALCEINAAWGVMNPLGQFKYVQMRTHEHDALYPSDTLYPSDELFPDDIYDDTLTRADYYQGSLTYAEYDTQPITKVIIREESDDVGYPYGTDGNTYIIEGNFLLYGATDEILATVAENFYSYASYIAYTPSEVKCKGAPWREVGDLLKIVADKGNLTMPILSRQLSGISALTDTYAAKGTETYGENINGMSEQLKQLKGRTNVLTRTLDETRLEVSKFETDVAGELKEMSSSIEQTAESINLKVSKGDVVSEINQSPESVKIEAKNISLNGVVTANNNFEILEDGSMKAVNGTFEGRITAGENSKIGGWTITDGKIYGGDAKTGVAVMQIPGGNSGNATRVFAAGGTSHDNYADCPFKVQKDGKLIAENITVGNKLSMYFYPSRDTKTELSVLDLENTDSYPYLYIGSTKDDDSNTDIINGIYMRNDVWCNKNLDVGGWFSVQGSAGFGNTITLGDVSGDYSEVERHINTYWADSYNDRHDLITAYKGGLNMGVGWSGKTDSKIYSTMLKLRGQTVEASNVSGITFSSDERLKNSLCELDEFDLVYMDLKPISFKYNNGASGRTHFGFGASQIRDAFLGHGYTTKDFGGFVQMNVQEGDEDYDGITDPMGLIYTEFVSWNTHMIQKTIKELNATKTELASLQEKYDALAAVVDTLKSKIE